MRYILLVLLVACSTTTTTTTVIQNTSPAATSNDARICEQAMTPPWNDGVIEALTRDSSTAIALKAAEVSRLFATTNGNAPSPVDAWDDLNAMCIDAGY